MTLTDDFCQLLTSTEVDRRVVMGRLMANPKEAIEALDQIQANIERLRLTIRQAIPSSPSPK
jgi:hypothetical protein